MPPGKEPRVSLIIAAKNLTARVFGEVRAGAKKVAGEIKGAFSGIKGVLGAIGVAAGGFSLGRFFSGAVQEARDAERASIDLRGSVENLGLSYDALQPKLDATIDRLSDLAGKDDEEVSDALSNLITKTGDLAGSLEQLPLVLGIARKEKIALAEASDKVAKVMNGNTKAARELGITTKDTGEALSELHKRYGSFAKDDSTTGILERIKNAWNNVKEAVGEAIFGNEGVRKSLAGVVEKLQDAERWVKEHREELGRFASAVAAAGERILQLLGFLARLAIGVIGFLGRYRETTMFVGASAAAWWGLSTVVTALGITSIPALIATLGRLRLAFLALATNPVVLAFTAIATAIGLITVNAGKARRSLDDLRLASMQLSDVQLMDRLFASEDKLRKAPLDASAREEQRVLLEEMARRSRERAAIANINIPKTPPRGGGDADANRELEQRIRLLGDALEMEQTRAAALRELSRIHLELTTRLNSGRMAEQQRFEVAKAIHSIDEIRAKDLERQRKLEEEQLDRLLAMTDPELLKTQRTKEQAEALVTLHEWQRKVNEALRAENDAIARGLGNLERKVQLEEQAAKIAERIGTAPKVGVTPSTPQAATTLDHLTKTRPDFAPPRVESDELKPFQEGLSKTIDLTHAAIDAQKEFGAAVAESAGVGYGALTSTALSAFEAVGAGQQQMGIAFGQAIRAGVVEAARHFASLYLAKALAAKGLGLLGHIGAFAAAAAFATAAGMFARIGGGGGRGGGGEGGGAGGGGGLGSVSGPDGGGGVLTVHLPSGMSVFDPNNAVMAREWKKMFEELSGRRVILQVGR